MKTILHIEPSGFFVELVKQLFKNRNYQYLSTDNYSEALELLDEFEVDLVVLSLEGNGMTSEEFIKSVSYTHENVPLCVLSGNKLNANMQHFMNLGVLQYIDKEDVKEALPKYVDNIFISDKYLAILREKEIAVVEDSHFSKMHLKEVFNKYDIQFVKYFESGEELKESNQSFDIYLIDLVLQDEFGKNIITDIREENKEALIYAVTSLNNPKLLADIIDSGADDIIAKPIEREILIAKLKSFIRKLY